MIRFCDCEVGCAEYELLSRSKLLSYFLSDHLDAIVSVYDHSDIFMGIITYYSLLYSVSIDAAICREYVILNDDIWQNARDIFKKKSCNVRNITLLPVLDSDYQLTCFAYQDEDANREIRMLRELQETQNALQFADVFPNYKCVKIQGFNELAFYFAEYLRNQNVMVQVDGAMWQDFLSSDECQVADYECLNIYAEGTWYKPYNWKENLLRSTSVEFECIDKIYEANIKNNLIKDTIGDYIMLLDRLRTEKEIILCGIGMRAQDTYDFLIGNGIEVCCFAVDELNVENVHRLFGKRILGLSEAACIYKKPVFIDCTSKHSSWGLGRTDYFDYMGYRRNKEFFLIRDYIEISGNNLMNTLKNTQTVLAGDCHLCSKLYEYFMQKKISVKGYMRTLPEDLQVESVPEVTADHIDENVLCIMVEPVYRSDAKEGLAGKEERKCRIAFLREKKIDNFTDYFCDIRSFIRVEQENNIKYRRAQFRPKKIVLGSILPYNGNIFFRSLLDSHPQILSIYYSDLNNLLFWICVRLSMERAENILSLFWKQIEGNEESISNRQAFIEKMESLLACDSRFTSQELFVMFHIAYMYMFGKDIKEDNIGDMIIYWEPHYLARDAMEQCVKWLDGENVSCDIINVVRNSIPQKGGSLKGFKCIKEGVKTAYYTALRRMPVEENMQNNKIVVKFEDLKCRPKEVLENICARWGMEWDDILMQTTQNGEEDVYGDIMQSISGFDLGPVYNIYDNFFSGADRLKLMIIDALWQKRYGYPYVEPDEFTRRELQEMFLKEFRFENPGDTTGFYKNRLELDDRIVLQNELRCRLQEVRCLLGICESIF